MKRVVSVSLGSSKRDHSVRVEMLGEEFELRRIGTNGSLLKAIEIINQLDGKVDAFGLGGIDLYLWTRNRRYVIRDALKLKNAAKVTPVVDGSGLKHTLERRVVRYLQDCYGLKLAGKEVLFVSAMDRYGMAEELQLLGCKLVIGDLMFALGIPIPLHSVNTVAFLANFVMPVVSRLPFSVIYPTGEKQEEIRPKYESYFNRADIIAGDFHFIRRNMPANLKDKVILTNTITPADVEDLKARGVKLLITTTPEFGGRSFGTNVIEAMLVAISGKRPEELTPEDYNELLDKLDFRPRIQELA